MYSIVEALRSAKDLFQEPLSSAHPPCFPHTDPKLSFAALKAPDARQGRQIHDEVKSTQAARVGLGGLRAGLLVKGRNARCLPAKYWGSRVLIVSRSKPIPYS